MKKILICNTLPIVGIALHGIIEDMGFGEGAEVIGYSDGFAEFMLKKKYDIICFGFTARGGNRLEEFLKIVEEKRDISFFVVSDMDDANLLRKITLAGVTALVSLKDSIAEIIYAIERAFDNDAYVSRSIEKKFLLDCCTLKLSPRENRIAQLLAEGKSHTLICMLLDLPPSTVSTIKRRIFTKLDIKSILELKDLMNISRYKK